jgi:predicted SAM-dependent methyltransferase
VLPSPLKRLYFASIAKLSIVNYLWRAAAWRAGRARIPSADCHAVLHLGCGPNYIAGFLNVEANILRKCDLWLDFTLGLPFPPASFDLCYASHVLEHLTFRQARRLAAAVFRVLKPDGGIRWVTPCLKRAVAAYGAGDAAYFSDFPDSRTSLGGRFNNDMLCRNEHRLMLDLSLMREILEPAGFVGIVECERDRTTFVPIPIFRLLPWENRPAERVERSLFVEARKPG